jgi:hypothetical protein
MHTKDNQENNERKEILTMAGGALNFLDRWNGFF